VPLHRVGSGWVAPGVVGLDGDFTRHRVESSVH
jgi:hypothetical protein